MLPPASRAISDRLSRAILMLSLAQIISICFEIDSISMRLKSWRRHRERIVIGILWGSVVAKINMTWAGGSSRVFKRALKAAVLSIWTSSMIYILYKLCAGIYLTFSRSSLIWSTLLLDAPSISNTSTALPEVISLQDLHTLHGTGAGPSLQFIAFANIRATVVFPVPLGPENRIAWATRPNEIALVKVRVTCSCLITWSKVCGRYLRARTR